MDLPLRNIALVVLPFAVFTVSERLLRTSITSPETRGGATFDGFAVSASLIDLIAASTLLICVCIGIVVYFLAECSSRLKPRSYWWLLGCWVLFSACIYAFHAGGTPLRAYQILGAAPGVCPALRFSADAQAGECGIALVRYLLDLSTPFLAAASVAAILGAISTLATSTGPHQVTEWKTQRRAADVWLFIGSGLLIAGLVFHHSWGRWLAANWGLSDAKEFGALIAAYTSFKGVQSSVLIAAYFIPIVCIFAVRADSIAMAMVHNPDRVDKYKERHGLDFPLGAVAKNIGAILAPFVASMLGPISDLVKSVG